MCLENFCTCSKKFQLLYWFSNYTCYATGREEQKPFQISDGDKEQETFNHMCK